MKDEVEKEVQVCLETEIARGNHGHIDLHKKLSSRSIQQNTRWEEGSTAECCLNEEVVLKRKIAEAVSKEKAIGIEEETPECQADAIYFVSSSREAKGWFKVRATPQQQNKLIRTDLELTFKSIVTTKNV